MTGPIGYLTVQNGSATFQIGPVTAPASAWRAAEVSRLVTVGWELKDNVSFAEGGGTIETTIVRSGSASVKGSGDVPSGASLGISTVALGVDVFSRGYFYIPTGGLPTNSTNILYLQGSSTLTFAILLEADGTLTLWTFTGSVWAQQGAASPAVSLDSWENRIELRGNVGTGSVDQCEGRLNGVQFAVASGLAITDTQLSGVGIGGDSRTPNVHSGAQFVAYADDWAVNDSSGAHQNSWPGSGKIVLLKPTSDSAVGTGWTLGTGTAAGGNAFDAVNNTPPTGVADLTAGSDLKQIRNASSNANVNYDANLTTYTNAGLGPSDTINVLVPIVATGAPVVTSAKAGTYGIASNPAIANVSLGAGGTAGAFWSGVAAGTYPTGWKWSFGTTTYAPSVTKGTSPVARITQVTASTRIADVCAMGMYVDYTPAVSPFYSQQGSLRNDPDSIQNIGQAVKRGAYFCLGEKWARRRSGLIVPSADRSFAFA